MSVNNFDVLKTMCERSMKCSLAPLGNLVNARKVKAGSQVTIGVGGDVVAGLAMGLYVGGLILADKAEFERVKKELEGCPAVCEFCGKPFLNCDCAPEGT